MKPRASASFCHWPNDSSTPPGQVGPSCVSRPEPQPRDDVVGAGALDRRQRPPARRPGAARRRGRPSARARNSKRKKSWNAPASRVAPLVGRHARQRRVVDEDRARRRLVHLREQLDERRLAGAVLADDRDDRAGRQRQRHVVEHERATCRDRRTTRARGGCRAADASGAGRSADARERRGVVLEPGQPPRAVHPEAAQEADLADRRADVGRQPRAGGEHQQHVAGRRARGPRRRTRPRRRRRRRRPPRPSVCHSAEPQRAAATGPYQRSQAARRSRDQALADAGDAHFLARRRPSWRW